MHYARLLKVLVDRRPNLLHEIQGRLLERVSLVHAGDVPGDDHNIHLALVRARERTHEIDK